MSKSPIHGKPLIEDAQVHVYIHQPYKNIAPLIILEPKAKTIDLDPEAAASFCFTILGELEDLELIKGATLTDMEAVRRSFNVAVVTALDRLEKHVGDLVKVLEGR